MAKLRLLLSSLLSFWAMRVAPKEMRGIMGGIATMLEMFPEELRKGREGGVIVVPWSITEEGAKLSEYLAEAALDEVADARTEYASPHYYDKMIGD
ncbi:hypothetical protein KEU06_08855 [Pseudaminobacter sp. 19-2017]|uniref:Uncharacterized protein n=1 Tax=Pseudaminobacter soli (ex Zhang et al. 2022) TaxID=2831468 RepID=A0A942I1Y3_9HYPH|nr:hypothetical protein [Pseudaminobacter soli]MBS3648737.1 hypothetical protein [Pseudaminobacter soli]